MRLGFVSDRKEGLVYDELEGGAELEWYEMQLTKPKIDELLKEKNQLHTFNPTDFEES